MPLDGDRWLLGPAAPEVVAVGVDEGGAVLRGADQALGFRDAGVALDGVWCQVQPPCAFEQADALAEQGMDLDPALAGGRRPSAVLRRHGECSSGVCSREKFPGLGVRGGTRTNCLRQCFIR
jgi:hypothetical protein